MSAADVASLVPSRALVFVHGAAATPTPLLDALSARTDLESVSLRGAALSEGGRAIITLPSTAASGQVSRIVSTLKSGAGVVTTPGHVHYVVTEYGVANLHGLSLQQRAEALISIAHPDFRGELRREVNAVRRWTL